MELVEGAGDNTGVYGEAPGTRTLDIQVNGSARVVEQTVQFVGVVWLTRRFLDLAEAGLDPATFG